LYDSSIKVVLITGQGNTQLAVNAMKSGAYDYLSKPIMLSGLKLMIEHLIGQHRKENLLSYYHEKQSHLLDIEQIIGACDAIKQVKVQIERIIDAGHRLTSGTPPPVLITGETGTGKQLVARALHFGGIRGKEPFIELNLAGIPSHLVESELFGYERGAFTDARERRMGLVESADGGTLFLDEIGELSADIQVRLLKFLEDFEVRRLGSVRGHKVDLQIISATNRPLKNLVADGRFRSDLLFRLNTMNVDVPPLRERGEDIMILARHFIRFFVRKYDKPRLEFAESAVSQIMKYQWPGNVRELRNKMEQAVLLCDHEEIAAEHLAIPGNVATTANQPQRASAGLKPRAEDQASDSLNGQSPHYSPGTTLEEAERDIVESALREVGGNVSKAARRLGISRDQMRYRIEKYGISDNK
jgi:DNA-binding NtrC family response regulator